MAERVSSRLARSILVGCGLGALGSGALLGVLGFRGTTAAPDCGALEAAECALEQEFLASMSRRQLLFGLALMLLSLGIFLWLTFEQRRQRATETA